MAPALEQIAKKLGVSEQLAGVTFLALANGAPDVIGAMSASNSDAGGVTQAVGALTGAGIFVSGVVAAVVVIASKRPIKVSPTVFYRDIVFFIGSLIILVGASIHGSINLVFAIGFLCFYAVYIILVAIEDFRIRKAK